MNDYIVLLNEKVVFTTLPTSVDRCVISSTLTVVCCRLGSNVAGAGLGGGLDKTLQI